MRPRPGRPSRPARWSRRRSPRCPASSPGARSCSPIPTWPAGATCRPSSPPTSRRCWPGHCRAGIPGPDRVLPPHLSHRGPAGDAGHRRAAAHWQGGDPVVQLQTAFGGGKTHRCWRCITWPAPTSTWAISPAASGWSSRSATSTCRRPTARCWSARRSTRQSRTSIRRYHPHAVGRDGLPAWRPGGLPDGRAGRPEERQPQLQHAARAVRRFGPCLVIIDELVAYARNIYGVDGLASGSFDSVMTFIQALTEAVRRSTDAMLLVAIPASDIEVGGEAGRDALESCRTSWAASSRCGSRSPPPRASRSSAGGCSPATSTTRRATRCSTPSRGCTTTLGRVPVGRRRARLSGADAVRLPHPPRAV